MAVKDKKPRSLSKAEQDAQPMVFGTVRPQTILKDYDVFNAALDRIRWVYEEFDGKVVVNNSGGKDSTVVLELAAIVAAERGEKVKCWWLDQECEFEATVDYQRYLMNERDDVDFTWYQIPFRLENSTNHDNHWLNVWGEGEEWVRDREPNSVHDNHFGEDTWYELLNAIAAVDWSGYASLTGIRGEESPARRYASRATPMYKWVTWSVSGGQSKSKDVPFNTGMRFQPIHDWTFTDIWKAINDNDWRYNEHYDHLYQYGVSYRNFRVSNYHHESALRSLMWLQEIEPRTWEAATKRLQGINTYGHLKKDQYPKSLPYMFRDWMEYAEFLIDKLPPDEEHKELFRKQMRRLKLSALDPGLAQPDQIGKLMVGNVIGNDFYGTHTQNFLVSLKNNFRDEQIRQLGRQRAAAAAAQAALDGEVEPSA